VPATKANNNNNTTLTHVRSMHPTSKVSLNHYNKNEEIHNIYNDFASPAAAAIAVAASAPNQLNDDSRLNTNYLDRPAEDAVRVRSKLRLNARGLYSAPFMLSVGSYSDSETVKALSLDSSYHNYGHTLYGNIPEACKTDSNSSLIYNFFELHVLLFHIAVLSCASFIQLYFYYKLVLMFLAVLIYLIGFYIYKIYECLAESMLINQPFLRTELALEMLFYVIFLHLIDRRVCIIPLFHLDFI
jgi:hypothetical protein